MNVPYFPRPPTAGQVTDTYDYDAFGELLTATGTTQNNYRYTGEQYDPEADMYYLRARYYDQSSGRFLVMDPYAGNTQEPMTLHRYLYAGANPVMYTDPSGEFFTLASLSTANAIRGILSETQMDIGLRILNAPDGEDDGVDYVSIGAAFAGSIPIVGSIGKWATKIGIDKLKSGGWLWRHEGLGHTIEKHVGKQDGYLLGRISNGLKRATTYKDLITAETAIGKALSNNRYEIKKWLRNSSKFKFEFDYEFGEMVGHGFIGKYNKINSTNIHIVLNRNGKGGYYVLTSFPNI